MATIGLSKPYYAKYAANGSTVTYSGGAVIGKAVELSMELENADTNVLYADNGAAESASVFAGGTLTLTTDDLLPDPMMGILGVKPLRITPSKPRARHGLFLTMTRIRLMSASAA